MLHAAAVHGRDMETVADWVMRHELNEAGVLLEDQRCSRLGFGNVLGLLHTEDRERSSIFSAASAQRIGSRGAPGVNSEPPLPGQVLPSVQTGCRFGVGGLLDMAKKFSLRVRDRGRVGHRSHRPGGRAIGGGGPG